MSAAIEETRRPRLARGVRLKEDKARGGYVLLAPERVLNANPTAVEVLSLCDGERTVAEVIDALAEKFSAERARIAADVASLLHELATKRMVEL